MAGSFEMLIGRDGGFTMDMIENLGDAYEALEECYVLIYDLSGGGDIDRIGAACVRHKFPNPWDVEVYEEEAAHMKVKK